MTQKFDLLKITAKTRPEFRLVYIDGLLCADGDMSPYTAAQEIFDDIGKNALKLEPPSEPRDAELLVLQFQATPDHLMERVCVAWRIGDNQFRHDGNMAYDMPVARFLAHLCMLANNSEFAKLWALSRTTAPAADAA